MRRCIWWIVAGAAVLVVGGVCLIPREKDGEKPKKNGYREVMEAEVHPLWRDLDSGRVKEGAKVSDLLEKYPTRYVSEVGRFQHLGYVKDDDPGGLPFTWLTVVAKEGRLVRAGAESCT